MGLSRGPEGSQPAAAAEAAARGQALGGSVLRKCAVVLAELQLGCLVQLTCVHLPKPSAPLWRCEWASPCAVV